MLDNGLTKKQRDIIIKAIAMRRGVKWAVLFGSRATGTFKPTSDIDIALFGHVTLDDQAKIASELEDTNLPQKVDLIRYNTITSQALKNHIKKYGVLIYENPDPESRAGSVIMK